MLNYYCLKDGTVECFEHFKKEHGKLIWIDLLDYSPLEIALVEDLLDLKLFSKKEREEIETSSKYIESEKLVGVNLNFLNFYKDEYEMNPVSFLLKDNVLITQREREYKSFADAREKLFNLEEKNGLDLFLTLLETRIDIDADLIELITTDINNLNRVISKEKKLDKEFLLHISDIRKSSNLIRETLMEKQRIVFAILKSKYFPFSDRDRFLVMNKDISSLLQHSGFNFDRLEFMQNTFIGLVGIEQNKTIKMLTIVTVIFTPPALIAGIYGMNFEQMPELKLVLGYPLSLVLMLLTSLLLFLIFRLKKWL
ncbi:CorA family divalent cation transporter [Marinifilum sp. D714]|uniref:CorA family divalent cation transporter n=1 Tax=Marinifilum sp. D714 TaxID=2937523 RepID=UPI0027CFB0B6|nr:CorA family divalent cation transporter [Marinifilum sp. D714]MDQ2178770.1 hypothetical protein [Marinifilum sp. D714]